MYGYVYFFECAKKTGHEQYLKGNFALKLWAEVSDKNYKRLSGDYYEVTGDFNLKLKTSAD